MPNLKYASNGKDFQEQAKEYVINMHEKKQKLHKKNGCYWSNMFFHFYDFDTLEEAQCSGVEYTKCKRCFKGDM